MPLFAAGRVTRAANIPEAVRDILGDEFDTNSLSTLEDAGIRVRTGPPNWMQWFFLC